MLRNYCLVALRHLRKEKIYSVVNVAGLAVGMACCILILLFVRDELSYDVHHQQADRVFRVAREWISPEGQPTLRLARISAPIAPALEEDLPEVQRAVRIWGTGGLIGRDSQHFNEPRLFFADAHIFDVFTIPFLRGGAGAALDEPFTIVLTEGAARKYFGDDDPLGQVLQLDAQYDLRVTGVVENPPTQTHFRYDFLVSMATLESIFSPEAFTNWTGNNSHATYLLLHPNADAASLEARLPAFLSARIESAAGLEGRLFLQPLQRIHLHSQLDTELGANGDIAYVYLFLAIALLVLLIACFNFMNLATARSARRAREVGLRKALGADRRQLVGQFLGEALLTSLCAMLVAGLLVELALPVFNDLSGKSLHFFGGDAGVVLIGLLAITFIVGVLSGSYPAFYLSAAEPARVLKGEDAGRRSRLYGTLVVAQFAIAFILVLSVGMVSEQLRFVRERPLGFDAEHLVVLPGSEAIISRFADVRAHLTSHPGVRSVTASRLVPSNPLVDHIDVRAEVGDGMRPYQGMPLLPVDHDFLDTYDVELAAGRTFSIERASDSSEAFILNESAVRQLGWTEPHEAVGKRFVMDGRGVQRIGYIIGVVKDFHFESLHTRIAPLVLFIMPERHRLVTVRISGGDVSGTLAFLESRWRDYRPGYPFTYALIDDEVAQLYQNEVRVGQIVGYAAFLAIFVACLGIFGLAAYTAERRTREIGIRKVLGASVGSIVALLSGSFIRFILVALVMATPLAYLVVTTWLDTFAYRVPVRPWIFIAAGVLTFVLALTTAGVQAMRAALADPVRSLRYD